MKTMPIKNKANAANKKVHKNLIIIKGNIQLIFYIIRISIAGVLPQIKIIAKRRE